MKTHKARWYHNNGRHTWHVGADHGVARSKRGAQIAARRSLAEQETT